MSDDHQVQTMPITTLEGEQLCAAFSTIFPGRCVFAIVFGENDIGATIVRQNISLEAARAVMADLSHLAPDAHEKIDKDRVRAAAQKQ